MKSLRIFLLFAVFIFPDDPTILRMLGRNPKAN